MSVALEQYKIETRTVCRCSVLPLRITGAAADVYCVITDGRASRRETKSLDTQESATRTSRQTFRCFRLLEHWLWDIIFERQLKACTRSRKIILGAYDMHDLGHTSNDIFLLMTTFSHRTLLRTFLRCCALLRFVCC